MFLERAFLDSAFLEGAFLDGGLFREGSNTGELARCIGNEVKYEVVPHFRAYLQCISFLAPL